MRHTVMPYAYFDCNATTPVLAAASQSALEAMQILYGNPSSIHLAGVQAKFLLESTRTLAAQAIGAQPEEIIFTSGATEAIQTAIFSALQSFNHKNLPRDARLLYSATEHKAIPQALRHWVKMLNLPYTVVELPVDVHGQILPAALRRELPHAALLCTMAVNNETGVIQDLPLIESILNEMKSPALWLVDCVQALGKMPLDFSQGRIQYAPFSGHKIYAPKGIGFLYVKKGTPFFPLIVGGGQEKGLRSGTENLPGVAALGTVLKQILGKTHPSEFRTHSQLVEFRDQIAGELKNAFPKIMFNTPFQSSVPTTINFSVPGLSSRELLEIFDSAGLSISSGSACNSASVEPSHVLDAMALPHWRSSSALRLSFGPLTAQEEIDRGCQIIRECAIALQHTCLLDSPGPFEAPENLRDGIIQFRTGPANSWLIAHRANRKCIVIDPCEATVERMESYIRCQKLSVVAVLDTHSHGDHTSAQSTLKKILTDFSPSPLPHLQDVDDLGWPFCVTDFVTLDNRQKVPYLLLDQTPEASLILAQLKTPGHTADSTALLLGRMKNGHLRAQDITFTFSGDTVLSGGLGRTNFSASQPKELFFSLRALQTVLHPTTLICPSHDYNQSFATHLQAETSENEILALALGSETSSSLDLFLQKKQILDAELARLEKDFQGVICGVTQPCSENSGSFLPNLHSLDPDVWVIDVREPQEFLLFKDWQKMGLSEAPRNIPLSRFVNFMSELLNTQALNRKILLLCRSGTRSQQAAKSLRRLGFTAVQSLEGGVALAL